MTVVMERTYADWTLVICELSSMIAYSNGTARRQLIEERMSAVAQRDAAWIAEHQS
jgi:hypothetical protein